jgi:hypothetical protein
MKEARKEDLAGILRKAWVDRTSACHEAESLLSQLQGRLREHQARLEQEVLRCARIGDEAGRVLRGGATACIRADAGVLAAQVIHGSDLTELILEQQKLLDPFYKKLFFGEGNGDYLELYKRWDLERAAVLVLTAAISLQKRTVAEVTRLSMQKFSAAVAPKRAENARAFLALVAQMQTLMQADQEIVQGLEPAEISLLRPRAFPVRILGLDVIEWFLDAISQGMIDPADVGNLMETVSTAQANLSAEQVDQNRP